MVRAGFGRASQFYAGQQILIPRLDDFRSAHTAIFAEVSGEAGQIRDEDCLVQIFGSVLDDCDMEEEFHLLGKQLSEMVTKAKNIQDCVVIVAFTHGRIVAAQPALFGNKRTAMCLALSQIRALFPIITTLNPFSINAYYETKDPGPDQHDPLAAELVTDHAEREHHGSERQRVRADHPLQLRDAGAQVNLHAAQRHADHRVVQEGQEQDRAEHGQRERAPAVARHRLLAG